MPAGGVDDRHAALGQERQDGQICHGSERRDKRKDPIAIDQLFDHRGGLLRIVGVVFDDPFDLAPIHSAGIVDVFEIGVGTLLHLRRARGKPALQRQKRAEHDLIV